MFNPEAQVQVLPIDNGQRCYVIDDALADPDGWVARAATHRAAFVFSPRDAYPGPQLAMPDAIAQQLDSLFAARIRAELGARRTLRLYCRLALATLPPEALQPRQWICHRDRFDLPADLLVAASVLYLFRDAGLGGTAFYRPRRGAAETARLVHDSGHLDGSAFSARYGIAPGYLTGSNDWFEKLAVVPPRFNRLLFYDGGLFHSSDITAPERLSDDPARGRLTLNGFFTCRRRAR